MDEITYPSDFILEHKYDLGSIELSYKKKVLTYKNKFFCRDLLHSNHHINFNLLFPGFIYTNKEYAKLYQTTVYKPYLEHTVCPPRGYVDHNSIIIIGAAPSDSRVFFESSAMLFGPAMYYFHPMLRFASNWYFTNACKIPFKNNTFNKDIAIKYYPYIEKELKFFRDHKMIFLGNYPIYDILIKNLQIKNVLRLTHPTYYVKFNRNTLADDQKKIKEFCLSTAEVGV